MKFLKSITVFAFLLCVSTSCAQWKKVKGDGNITTESRSTGDYDGVSAAGSMDINLVEGNEGNIKIKGDANLMEYIITEVKNGKLHVKTKKGVNLKPSKTIEITVPYESINYVGLAGSGDVQNSGTIRADNFEVSLAGSGDIELNVSSDSVKSNIAGSGDISLSGSATNLETNIAGSGDFESKGLNSKNVTAKISGSGDVSVVCNGALKVRIAGSGDVSYSGTPTSKDTKVSGSGSVSN